MDTIQKSLQAQHSHFPRLVFCFILFFLLIYANMVNAAWNKGTIYVTVWNDVNKNAQIDTGENGITGIVLELELKDKTCKQKTRELGQCSFKYLYADEYELSVDSTLLPAGATCTTGALSRNVQVNESICDPAIAFGFSGIPAEYLGDEIIPTIPENYDPDVEPNSLVLVAGTPVYSGRGRLGWDNATDGDTNGWDGTTLAAADLNTGDDRPWAIFRFADGSLYKFNYINFQTDNGSDDDGSKYDNQVKRIEVLISNAGTEMSHFTSIGTFKTTYGTNRMQWNKLAAYRTAKYVKVRLLDPIPKYSGHYLQLVEFGVNTEKKNGPEPVLESLIIIAAKDEMSNFPNPFNPTTTINYKVNKDEHVSIDIFDLTGEKVAELVNEYQASGKHQAIWNASDMPSGVYFVHLHSNSKSIIQRILLIK